MKCSNQKCLFCDFSNNYFYDDGFCVQKVIQNCTTVYYDGTCWECNQHFYIDSSGIC